MQLDRNSITSQMANVVSAIAHAEDQTMRKAFAKELQEGLAKKIFENVGKLDPNSMIAFLEEELGKKKGEKDDKHSLGPKARKEITDIINNQQPNMDQLLDVNDKEFESIFNGYKKESEGDFNNLKDEKGDLPPGLQTAINDAVEGFVDKGKGKDDKGLKDERGKIQESVKNHIIETRAALKMGKVIKVKAKSALKMVKDPDLQRIQSIHELKGKQIHKLMVKELTSAMSINKQDTHGLIPLFKPKNINKLTKAVEKFEAAVKSKFTRDMSPEKVSDLKHRIDDVKGKLQDSVVDSKVAAILDQAAEKINSWGAELEKPVKEAPSTPEGGGRLKTMSAQAESARDKVDEDEEKMGATMS